MDLDWKMEHEKLQIPNVYAYFSGIVGTFNGERHT